MSVRPAQPAQRLRRLPRRRVLGLRVPVANRPLARLLGLALLPRRTAGVGLLIPRCHAVHTLGMRFPLTVVFLDSSGQVSSRRERVPPGRFVADRRADAVLEIPG